MFISVNKRDIQALVGCTAAATGLMAGVFALISKIQSVPSKYAGSSLAFAVLCASILASLTGLSGYLLSKVDKDKTDSETCYVELSPAFVKAGFALVVLGYISAAVTGLILLYFQYDNLTSTQEENEIWGTFGFTAAIIALLTYPSSVFVGMLQQT